MKKLMFILIIGCFLASCSKDSAVKYQVTGTSASGFNVEYNIDGQTIRENGVDSGWTKSFSVEEGSFLYISAETAGTNTNVHVIIYVDNYIINESSSKGDNVRASASANYEK